MSLVTLASKTYMGHTVRVLGHAKPTKRAAMRHLASDRAPDPPSVARRLREASGSKVETIEERMAREAARVHSERRVTELASGVPAPPDMHVYAVARRRGLTHAEAIAEARS